MKGWAFLDSKGTGEPPKRTTNKRPPKQVAKLVKMGTSWAFFDGVPQLTAKERAKAAKDEAKRAAMKRRRPWELEAEIDATDTSNLNEGDYPDPAFPWARAIPTEDARLTWGRPSVDWSRDVLAPANGMFEFQILHAQAYYVKPAEYRTRVDSSLIGVPGEAQVPLVRLFGVTDAGNSGCVHVWGFFPHFLVRAPSGMAATLDDAPYIKESLETLLVELQEEKRRAKYARPHQTIEYGSGGGRSAADSRAWYRAKQGPNVIAVEPTRMYTTGKYEREKSELYRVYLRTPNLVPTVRDYMHNCGGADVALLGADTARLSPDTFDSTVKFETRFLANHHIVGCGWVSIAAEELKLRRTADRESRCDIEFDVHEGAVVGETPESRADLYERLSRYRILSYDIECMSVGGVFPTPETDGVIQICCVLATADAPKEPLFEIQLAVGSVEGADWLLPTGSVETCRRYCFQHERELLRWWAIIRRASDYDIITGYNTKGFDDRYVFLRTKFLGLTDEMSVGRLRAFTDKLKENSKSSAQYGNRTTYLVQTEGRVAIDVLEYVRAEYKLRNYKLNTVATKFLGDQKEDMSYDQIPILQNGSAADRRLLLDYCKKDARLPLDLIARLDIPTIYIERSRVQCCQLADQQDSGSTARVFSQLVQFVLDEYAILVDRTEYKHELKGATVIAPKRGFYKEPVLTLDFSALYPSIGIAHNLCVTTLVPPDEIAQWDPKDIETCPKGHTYVRKHVREGVIPKLFASLLEQRGYVKKLMYAAQTKALEQLYNGRQLGLKISANSIFGGTSRRHNGIYWWQIGESITAYGREQLDLTEQTILKEFTVENGYRANAIIVYGDTDSVMVHFGIKPAPAPAWIQHWGSHHLATESQALDFLVRGRYLTPEEAENPDAGRTPETTKKLLQKAWRKKSVFDAMNTSMELGVKAAKMCTAVFTKPNELELENGYWPYLLLNKKRYAGPFWGHQHWDYEKHDMPTYKKVQGLELKRRDNALIVMQTQTRVLDIILEELDVEKAFTYACSRVQELCEGRYDMRDLVISKELKKTQEEYASPQPQAEVHKKMKARAPGTEPRIGDRVPYVMIQTDSQDHTKKAARAFEKAEDPMYVVEHRLPIDVQYYVERQLLKPLKRVFKPLMKNFEGRFLRGPHTTRLKKFRSASPLDNFIVINTACLACRAPMSTSTHHKHHHGLCAHCQADAKRLQEVDKQHRALLKKHEDARAALEDRCRQCQGNRYGHVTCANTDCEIFFTRSHRDRDAKEQREIIEALEFLRIDNASDGDGMDVAEDSLLDELSQ